jgi:hypothetical protein
MASSDFWAHVLLVVVSFLVVVGPRLLSPGHEVNTLISLIGGAVVIAVAAAARYLTVRSSADGAGEL